MKIEEKKPMSFKTLMMVISACICLLAAVLIVLSYTPEAFAGDATSFNPTSVAVQARAASDTPIGGVIPYRGSSVPDGWLECNGQSTAGYPELAAVVGANVPDLRGEFIRGLDSGRGVDTGRTLGSTQADAMEEHRHDTTLTVSGSYNITVKYGDSSMGGAYPYGIHIGHGPGYLGNYAGGTMTATGTGTSTSAGDGSENRPRNVALMYIIKAQ
ncbi:phage tail protein [Desulfovibrio sp. JC010]|uniref:phage tail protein n=1 Tax=Desulfovibrio sp. JC010 TaxID=2593641 RepID=UPI0013D7F77A|nr:tail fiber protein [Desulfovibrio sp. JC010]NDV26910.1 tail fiber protein [Desulfovibrio sp. JC010]